MQKNDAATSPGWDIVVAGSLLTRLPLPHAPKAAFDHQARAVWAYPLWGLIVGLIACLAGVSIYNFTGHAGVAGGGTLAASMLLTGAMHEDGLADTFDGFWGGFTPARRLEIMKDSHIGTYGVLALILTTGLRWVLICSVISGGWTGVMAAMVISRAVVPAVMCEVPRARSDGLSTSVGRPVTWHMLSALAVGMALALMLVGVFGIVLMVAAGCVAALMGWMAWVRIGGQTGDVLGATQVLAEISVLILILWAMT